MVPQDRRGTLLNLAARLERECMDSWRNQHSPGTPVVDALAEKAREVETRISRKLGGNISVTVSVKGNRPSEDETWFFSLQRINKGTYEVRRIS